MTDEKHPPNNIPSEASIDAGRQEQAKAYARISRRLILVDLLIGAAYLLAWLAFGWSLALENALLAYTNNEWLLVAGFTCMFGAIFLVVTLPLSFFEGYVLPHRFGQSNQTLGGWIGDQVKMIALGGLLGLLVLEVIYAVLRAFPDTWWLWAAAFLLVFNVLLSNLAPVLLFPIFYKFIPLSQEHAELAERLVKLFEREGKQVSGVYQFDMSRRTKAANAALVGLGNTRRIILGDTLLNEFTPEEIETVMAHELGHHVHKDIPIGILVESIITLVGLYLASLGLEWGAAALGFSGPADIAALPLLGLVLGAYGLVTMPLTNAYSRWREREADRYALKTTHNGAAYASALARLANQNLAEADPPRWEEILLHSHPALSKRIVMAQSIQ